MLDGYAADFFVRFEAWYWLKEKDTLYPPGHLAHTPKSIGLDIPGNIGFWAVTDDPPPNNSAGVRLICIGADAGGSREDSVGVLPGDDNLLGFVGRGAVPHREGPQGVGAFSPTTAATY